jgi:hypothetical protein
MEDLSVVTDDSSFKDKPDPALPDDPRPEWEREDRQLENRKPDLEEIEDDPSGFE